MSAAKSKKEAAAEPKKRGRPPKIKTEATVEKESAVKSAQSEKKTSRTAEKSAEKTQKSSKKAAPQKPGEEKAAKKRRAKQEKPTEPSSKTPQVMRLVEQRNDMVNPTIMAGKSSIPRQLRGLEPLTKIMKREAEVIFGADEDDETFNLTALVIDDNAAEILRRFNACDCEMCIEQLSRLTADSVPARFVKLKRRSVERKAPEVEELKAPLKRPVTSRMIRLVMQNKKRSFHDI
ncbi:MAG: hypothetical protein E7485_05855 [Ruminococcaceae bacterium]|nr:hypothetical protein [Oscillospiraceae bacterium]